MASNDNFSLGDTGKKKKHALVIPFLFHAHVAGIYRFSLELVKRGVTITLVVPANDASKMAKYEEIQGLDFHFISFDESVTQVPVQFHKLLDFGISYGEHFDPILQELKGREKAGIPAPTCIIYDRFCYGAVEISKKLGIPHYMFFSCGAVLARFHQEAPRLLTEQGPFEVKEDGSLEPVEGRIDIPGLPPLSGPDIQKTSFTAPRWKVGIGRAMADASGIIINTFYELEKPQIDEIRRQCAEQAAASGRKSSELFLVGPLSEAATFKDRSFVGGASESDNQRAESLQWLDSQKPQSVIYICFGSWVEWKPNQVEELAVALEASEQSFLWVLSRTQEPLPAGFEQRVTESGKGFIANGWVPQLQILQHASINSFLSHCGWNSSLESISLGVPMLCWPQNMDQPMNARYIVDSLKAGVQVGVMKFDGPALVRREDFVRAFKVLMDDDDEEGKAIRSKVKQLKLIAREVVGEGGARRRALDELAQTIPENA
ncbi:hypothetical protein R1flu_002804 [Riccia fluitans]|uniref:Glycosyltransferase n=1 Tax=Riccia fluitans TaxID=41844 RepID=A0ABD1Y848_9MARC